MNVIESIISFLRGSRAEDKAPEGFCPNCWGRAEYGGKFFEAIKQNNVDVNSKNPNVGWVQDYADKHLSGIQLKQESDGYVCQKCKLTYRSE